MPVTLELGGKSPMIVMADADLDRAVAGAVTGMRFTRQGQSCTAASRIFVHASLHDAFVARLKEKVDAMKMGDPLDEATDIGCIISRQQLDKVKCYIELGRQTPGAKAIECSALPTDPKLKDGLFVRRVIVTGLGNDSKVAREEIFGPVTCVIQWTDYEQVIGPRTIATTGWPPRCGPRTSRPRWTRTRRLQAGFVQVNQNLVVQPGLSYGGVKRPGWARRHRSKRCSNTSRRRRRSSSTWRDL